VAAAAPIGGVSVGQYRLEVGGAGGTLISQSPDPSEGNAARLARALEHEPPTRGEAAQEVVDSASEVTTRVEQAFALLKDLAAGRIDPRDASTHVDQMLELLDRLDSQGRWEEARDLARALNGVLALVFRWVDLVRSLKLVRAAAERVGDRTAWAWSEHELGSLHLAAGDPAGANRRLEEAHRIRREIGDRAGLAATEHNLQVLCQQLRAQLPDGKGRSGLARRLLLPAAVGIALLLAGGAAGAALDSGGDDGGGSGTPPDGEEAQLAVQRQGAGSVTSAPAGIRCPERCTGRFPRGTGVVLTARPAGDAIFVGWRGGGCQGTVGCELRLARDTTVTATFAQAPPSAAILRVRPSSNGVVTSDPPGIACPETCERAFSSGAQIALTPAAAEGFVFARWAGDCTGSGPCTLTMTADLTVAAIFVPAPTVTVTVTVSGDGAVTSEPGDIDCGETCSTSVKPGVPIVLTPTAGLREWGGACAGAGATCTLTPEVDTSATAVFGAG
jgi:List-Bact-rpt repeat protein